MKLLLLTFVLGSSSSLMLACGSPQQKQSIQATYDQKTGKLSQLTVNAQKDGKPNIYSYMDGTKFVRIEIDSDEDDLIDRWEYYGPDQKIEKVGFSRANDGKSDAWAYSGPDGTLARVEVSTRHDGNVNRTEFYLKGVLVRAEEDTDQDGRVDKWETFRDGALASVAFDTKHTGAPDRQIDYDQVPAGTRPTPQQPR